MQDLNSMPREIANILLCNFATFAVCFLPQICIDVIENHILHVTISLFIRINRELLMVCKKKECECDWPISCKTYGLVIALHCMTLLYIPSNINWYLEFKWWLELWSGNSLAWIQSRLFFYCLYTTLKPNIQEQMNQYWYKIV